MLKQCFLNHPAIIIVNTQLLYMRLLGYLHAEWEISLRYRTADSTEHSKTWYESKLPRKLSVTWFFLKLETWPLKKVTRKEGKGKAVIAIRRGVERVFEADCHLNGTGRDPVGLRAPVQTAGWESSHKFSEVAVSEKVATKYRWAYTAQISLSVVLSHTAGWPLKQGMSLHHHIVGLWNSAWPVCSHSVRLLRQCYVLTVCLWYRVRKIHLFPLHQAQLNN